LRVVFSFIITPKLNYTRAAPQDRYSIPTIRGLALYGGLFLACYAASAPPHTGQGSR
jgi:hypothetical protein